MKISKLILTALIICVFFLPITTFAQQCTPNVADVKLCNGFGNVDSLYGFATRTFTFVGTIIGLLAVTMIVYSGFRMLISRGEPDGLKVAKTGFSYAIIGVVVSVMSFVLVLAVQNFIGVDSADPDLSGKTINNPLVSPDGQQFILRIISVFLGLVGVLASVMIVYNGFLYLTAGGNEDQVKTAKSGLLWSILGFGTVILAYVIITALRSLFV